MGVLIRNGWEIYFHRQLFGEQRRQLRERVKQLKAELPEADYLGHPDRVRSECCWKIERW